MKRGTFAGVLGGLALAVVAATGIGVASAPAAAPPPASLTAAPLATPSASAPGRDADPLAGVVIAERDAAAEADWTATEAKARAKAGRDARTTYFGSPWIDTDRNGCPTDDDIARRDLVDWAPAGRCEITGGSFTDYEGKVTPDGPRRKQLDHVVALHRVFTGGGAYLTAQTRIQIANDPDNLIYTSAHDNESKGDDTASEYLPADPAQRCRYAGTYVVVVKRYGLAVTAADAAALRAALARCPA